MATRDELIELTGQILNGMMSADSSIASKVLEAGLHKRVARIAVSIANEALNIIDKEYR